MWMVEKAEPLYFMKDELNINLLNTVKYLEKLVKYLGKFVIEKT